VDGNVTPLGGGYVDEFYPIAEFRTVFPTYGSSAHHRRSTKALSWGNAIEGKAIVRKVTESIIYNIHIARVQTKPAGHVRKHKMLIYRMAGVGTLLFTPGMILFA